jgi:predicted nucleic acid-binding protein
MSAVFVDSNVFLRFFTRDDEPQAKKADELFRKAATGEIQLVTGPPVLFELAWTLRAAYRLSQEEILDILSAVVAHPGLRLTDAHVVPGAIALARQSGIDFADAYIAVAAQFAGTQAVATFNQKDFSHLGSTLHRW